MKTYNHSRFYQTTQGKSVLIYRYMISLTLPVE